MIYLRKAEIKESAKILQFYRNVIKSIDGSEFKPKWSNSYPNSEYIEASIKNEDLYLCRQDSDIIASLVLNSSFSSEYEDINWIVNAKPEEITVIHAFAVGSNFAGKGIGKEIFKQIKENSLKDKKKTIRIDIINGNTGAQKVFEAFGFEYVDTVEVFHNAVGLEKFHLYEHVL